MTYTATYSPDDNKLRLYASSRLSPETYATVKAAGFKWAPKQELFVAPMWTPEREDLLLELAGEVEDEDKSLVERAEERADRFETYSDNRKADAEAAQKAVSAIADNIPFGQPILVGHHSEKRARKDKERIENGMRRSIKMWDQSAYWTQRAAGSLRAAKYKERPDVRARRVKTLEAAKRKCEKNKKEATMWLKTWAACEAMQDPANQLEQARKIANCCWLHLARKEGDTDRLTHNPTAYDALQETPSTLWAPRTIQEVFRAANNVYPRCIAINERWIAHYENRLTYERAMLAEGGGTVVDQTKPEVGGAIRCWSSLGYGRGWSYIVKVNKTSVTIWSTPNYGDRKFRTLMPFDKIKAIMSKEQVELKRSLGELQEVEGLGFYMLGETPAIKAQRGETEDPAAAMKAALKAGVQTVSAPQLFPTPKGLAGKMVELAEIQPGERVLEPSAGTGNILLELPPQIERVAVEINQELAGRLQQFADWVVCADFLECNGDLGKFNRILMNPPFEKSVDIKHIEHAMGFLKPGGRLVAICANGPRQNDQLKPQASQWLPLPAGTFKEQGTGVNTALMVYDAPIS